MQILGIKYISPMCINNPRDNPMQGASNVRHGARRSVKSMATVGMQGVVAHRIGQMRLGMRHIGSGIVLGFPLNVVGLGEVGNHLHAFHQADTLHTLQGHLAGGTVLHKDDLPWIMTA